jgi:predicted nucleotidyltransferase
MSTVENQIKEILTRFPIIEIATLFGSFATGRQTPESDFDFAVASSRPLSLQARLDLSDALADRFQRPIDLIDLNHAAPPLLREALVNGKLILCHNNDLMTDLILRLWHNEADLMPCYRQAQQERQEAFARENGLHPGHNPA